MIRDVPLLPELSVDFLLVLLVGERNASHVLESGWENTPLAENEFDLGREKAVSQEFHPFLLGHDRFDFGFGRAIAAGCLGLGCADGSHDLLETG
jgi:hypothetical protein